MNKKILLIFSIFLFPTTKILAEEIKLGVIPSLTGTFADLGEDCRRGAELAMDSKTDHGKINNYQVSLVYGDSQADPKTGISEFNRLVDQEKVLAVLTMRSPIGMSLNPISKAKGIPLAAAVGHPKFPVENEYAFQFWPSTVQEGGVLAKKALELNYKDLIALTLEDDWTLSLTEGFKKALENNGGQISLNKTFLPGETDFSTIVTQLRSKKADAIFVNLSMTNSPIMIKRLREQGVKLPILTNFWMGDGNAIKTAGIENVEGVIFPEVSLKYSNFEQKLNQLNPKQKRPSAMTYSCYSGLAFFLEALKNDKNIKNSTSFYTTLNKTNEVKLLDSIIEIKDRRVNFPVVIKTIKNGQVVE